MRQSVTLSQTLSLVKEAVSMLFEEYLWVTAEVLRVSGTNYRTLELVEYDADKKEIAKTTGKIWGNKLRLLDKFKEATGNELSSGMKVLIKVKPVYHEVYGLSLQINDLDPTYTLGDMEANLAEIRKRLKEKQWWDLNKGLSTPKDFLRLAVISPDNAAGLGDFRYEADKLEQAGLCSFSYFPALFQGAASADKIVEKMVSVLAIHQQTPFDALILIRGGGDKAGLYHLNNYKLIASVCRFPLPVFVGIGHERDKVLLDEVANSQFPTPSLLISSIRNRIVENANDAWNNHQKIMSLAREAILKSESDCDQMISFIRSSAQLQLDRAEQALSNQQQNNEYTTGYLLQEASDNLDKSFAEISGFSNTILIKAVDLLDQQVRSIKTGAESALLLAEKNIDTHVSSVMSSNPIAILGKGYAYVKKGAEFVRSSQNMSKGDKITVKIESGELKAEILEVVHG